LKACRNIVTERSSSSTKVRRTSHKDNRSQFDISELE
jgi:hypothetical protein